MLAVALAVLALARPADCAQSSNGLRAEVVETFLRMRLLAAFIDTQAIEGSYPGPTAGLIPVSSLGNPLMSRVRNAGGAARDGWGNPLLYWSDGRDYLILSLGSDRTMQFNYDVIPPYANVPTGLAGADPTNDLLVVDGFAFRGPVSERELLRRAMRDLRSMGTACESYGVDYNLYPGPVDPIDAIASIETVLAPIYISVLPTVDPWGNPYLFWSDSAHYALVSYGPDGIPDYPYASWGRAEFEALHTGQTTRLGQDLVFVTGAFVQYPAIVFGP